MVCRFRHGTRVAVQRAQRGTGLPSAGAKRAWFNGGGGESYRRSRREEPYSRGSASGSRVVKGCCRLVVLCGYWLAGPAHEVDQALAGVR